MPYNPYRLTYNANSYREGPPTAAGLTTVALDSAYTYDSAGDAFAGIFLFDTSATLTDIWVYVDSFTGTWGSTDGVINVEIREISASTTNKPGSLVTNGSFTITLAGTESGEWVKHTISTPPTVGPGNVYAICIGDADGGGTNYVTLGRSTNAHRPGPTTINMKTTADGWTTPANVSGVAAICVKQNSVMWGCPFTGIATQSSSDTFIGNRFSSPYPFTIIGAYITVDSLVNDGIYRLYAGDSTIGTPLQSWAHVIETHVQHDNAGLSWCMFTASNTYDIEPDTVYTFGMDRYSALTVPRSFTVGGGIDADLRSLFPFDGTMYKAEDEGGGSFTLDADELTAIGMVMVPLDNSGGGGGETFTGSVLNRGIN